MSVRMTNANKWKDPWFRKLSTHQKLMFLYICDSCDVAGFLEIDDERISFETGMDIKDVSRVIQGLSKGCLRVGQWLWVKNFLKHQKYLPIPKNNVGKGINKRLYEMKEVFPDAYETTLQVNPWATLDKGLPKGTGEGYGLGKGLGKGYILGEDDNPFK